MRETLERHWKKGFTVVKRIWLMNFPHYKYKETNNGQKD